MIDDVLVSPLRMNVAYDGLCFPEYTVVDSRSGALFELQGVLSGGLRNDPDGPCVCEYSNREGTALVLKILAHNDSSGEVDIVPLVPVHTGFIVPARVVRTAVPPLVGLRMPDNYSVVVMPKLGAGLEFQDAPQLGTALTILLAVTRQCAGLLAHGFAYTDLKPANVLDLGDGNVLLCDYGGLSVACNSNATATYPPPEAPRGVSVLASERSITYGLGALLVCLHCHGMEQNLRFITERRMPDEAAASAKLTEAGRTAARAVYDRSPLAAAILHVAWSKHASLRSLERAITLAVAIAGDGCRRCVN
jgi:hypothetical protein